MSIKPQIICADFGQHNAQLDAAVKRLDYQGVYKDLSTIILIPGFGTMPTKCVASWMNMVSPPNNKLFRMWALGMEVGEAFSQSIANILAHPELSKFKYLLTLEHDNTPPMDGLVKLIAQMEAHPEFACIGGLYWTKGPDGVPQIWGDPRAADQPNFRPQRPVPGQLVECVGTGMGFNLWRMDMFKDERLRKPWFKTVAGSEGVGTQDLYAWSDFRKYGYRCAIDCDVLVGHYDLLGNVGGIPDYTW
ncbi:MAG: hypothetical protein ACK5QX_05660 [bacterium]